MEHLSEAWLHGSMLITLQSNWGNAERTKYMTCFDTFFQSSVIKVNNFTGIVV